MKCVILKLLYLLYIYINNNTSHMNKIERKDIVIKSVNKKEYIIIYFVNKKNGIKIFESNIRKISNIN